MISNLGELFRRRGMRNRSQTYNSHRDCWVKRDEGSGRFLAVKKDGKPFKSVRIENPTGILRFPPALSANCIGEQDLFPAA